MSYIWSLCRLKAVSKAFVTDLETPWQRISFSNSFLPLIISPGSWNLAPLTDPDTFSTWRGIKQMLHLRELASSVNVNWIKRLRTIEWSQSCSHSSFPLLLDCLCTFSPASPFSCSTCLRFRLFPPLGEDLCCQVIWAEKMSRGSFFIAIEVSLKLEIQQTSGTTIWHSLNTVDEINWQFNQSCNLS